MDYGLILFFVIILFITSTIFREYRHELERRDLYSRIMAEDLKDYSLSTGTRKPPKQRNAVKAGIRRYYDQQESLQPLQSFHQKEGDA